MKISNPSSIFSFTNQISKLLIILLFSFLSNYISDLYSSYSNAFNDKFQIVNEIDIETNENSENSEKESEIEDSDEIYFSNKFFSSNSFILTIRNSNLIYSELSLCIDIDLPPPIS